MKIYSVLFLLFLTLIVCRFLPYVGWVTIIMTEKPIIKVHLYKSLAGSRKMVFTANIFSMHTQADLHSAGWIHIYVAIGFAFGWCHGSA